MTINGWYYQNCLSGKMIVQGSGRTSPIEFIVDDIRLERLFVGATLLVLAEIFRIGAVLQEEQDLTI